MIPDKAPVIPLHLHPGFQDRQRVNELKNVLMSETLAYVQIALDNAVGPGGASPRAVKILERARALLDEARDQLVYEMFNG
ncbi:MAG: hypothetical protein ACOZFS_10290 [Thermodesulfobacteriota bacterium]